MRHRVNRDGSWNDDARNARSANRNGNAPANRDDTLGVRPSKPSHARTTAAPQGPPRSAGDDQIAYSCRL